MDELTKSDIQSLTSYIPYNVLTHVSATPSGMAQSVEERFDAAVFFTDVSGFTELAESLAARTSGAEDLSLILNEQFGIIIDSITGHGGYVADFIGDAIIALWRVSETRDLEECVERAAACALALKSSQAPDQGNAAQPQLKMHTCVGCGEVWTAIIKGVDGRSYWLTTGKPIDDVRAIESEVSAGEVVATDSAWSMLADKVAGTTLKDDLVVLDGSFGAVMDHSRPVSVRVDSFDTISPYLPPPVLASLPLGQLGWLAELRFMVVGFVNLGPVVHASPDALRETRDLITVISNEVTKTGGVIWELVADAKGTVAMIAWGLLGSSHEDDRSRSLISGMAILAAFQASGRQVDIGIAAGRGFCGDRGNAVRREYALVGNTVNRAARLMEAANNEVLCDAEVALPDSTTGQTGLRLVPTGRRAFKGIADPMEVFRPEIREAPADERISAALIGRSNEKAAIVQHFDALVTSGPGDVARLFVLEGEPGTGKSTLLAYAKEVASERGLISLHGAANSVERIVAYHPWREVVVDALGLSPNAKRDRETAVEQALLDTGQPTEYASLLNMVCSTNFPETELTLSMPAEGRAAKTNELLTGILRNCGGLQVVFLEDAHWFDSSSWALLKRISNEIPEILIFLTTRPVADEIPEEHEEVMSSSHASRFVVGPLSESDTRQLIVDHFRCRTINPELASFIFQRGNGNPFFTKELTQIISSRDLITVHNGYLSTDATIAELEELIPTRVENVVSARIDQLHTNDQLVLKIASVVNSEFPIDTLVHVDPLGRSRSEISTSIRNLMSLDFLVPSEDSGHFQFRHAIIEKVAYEKLLFSQRRLMHARVADWFRAEHEESPDSILAVLAYHYAQAQMSDKALQYSDLAGAQALRNNANREALQLLSTARDLSEEAAPDGESGEDKARRMDSLSEALFRLRQEGASEENVQVALTYLGLNAPGNPVTRFLGILGFVMSQVAVRVGRKPASHDQEPISWRLAYRLYDRYSKTAYLRMDVLSTLYATLAALYSAERIGPSPELARAYASVCGASGIVPLHGVAASYGRRALAALRSCDDAEAEATVYQLLALYACGTGDWQTCYGNLARSSELFERLGDRASYAMNMQIVARSYSHQGRYTELARLSEEMLSNANRNDVAIEKIWSVNNLLECQLMSADDYSQVIELAELNYEVVSEKSWEPGNVATTISLIAITRIRMGHFSLAVERATEALEMLESLTGFFVGVFVAYRYSFTACHECWKHAVAEGRATEEVESLTRRAYRQLKRFARVYPIAEPAERSARGCIDEMHASTRSAVEKWRMALHRAERMELSYDAAYAHLYLSRVEEVVEEERDEHAAEARELFGTFAVR